MNKVTLSTQMRMLVIYCLTFVFIISFPGCESQQPKDETPKTDAQLHREQIISFRNNVQLLDAVLKEHQVKEVLFSGTMTIQSADIPVYIAPVKLTVKPDVEQFLEGPTPYAVLYTPSEITLKENNVSLKSGSYLLTFKETAESWNTELVDAAGSVATVLTTRNFTGICADIDDEFDRLKEKAREKLKKLDLDIKIVDIEIEFGAGTEFFASFLFWRWSLFEDPPLPY